MSFVSDPYSVMEVIKNSDGTVGWKCASCGGGWRYSWPANTPVEVLQASWEDHVKRAHNLSPKDTEKWTMGTEGMDNPEPATPNWLVKYRAALAKMDEAHEEAEACLELRCKETDYLDIQCTQDAEPADHQHEIKSYI